MKRLSSKATGIVAKPCLLSVVKAFIEAAQPDDFLVLQSGAQGSVEFTVHGNEQASLWMPSIRGPLGESSLELLKTRYGVGLCVEGEL